MPRNYNFQHKKKEKKKKNENGVIYHCKKSPCVFFFKKNKNFKLQHLFIIKNTTKLKIPTTV